MSFSVSFSFFPNFFFFAKFVLFRKTEGGGIEKHASESKPENMKDLSPCKSDDSGYSSGNSFDENPFIEGLVNDINDAFIQKKSLGMNSENLKVVKSMINRKLIM